MLYPNIVEARRGREEHKNHHNSSPHHRVITCLCCFAVYLLFSHKYFRIRICEVFSLVKILLVTFCKLSARCWLLWCVRDNQLLSNLQNQCFLATHQSMVGLACCHCQSWSPPTISHQLRQRGDGELLLILESGSSISSSASASVSSLQLQLKLQLQQLHHSVLCVLCVSVTGSSGVTQLLTAV